MNDEGKKPRPSGRGDVTVSSDEQLIELLEGLARAGHASALREWGSSFMEGLDVEGRTEWKAASRLRSLLEENQKLRIRT